MRYAVARLDEIDPQACPCGTTRRAFTQQEGDGDGDGEGGRDEAGTATLHLVEISADSRAHYHRKLTELYLVLEGEGHFELDGERVPVRPMTAALIRPGCRHRAVGELKLIVTAIPAFDPADEWFD